MRSFDASTNAEIPDMQRLSCISRCGRLVPAVQPRETPHMLFAISIGRFTFELTRSDVLLRFGGREMYWNWYMRTGLVFERVA